MKVLDNLLGVLVISASLIVWMAGAVLAHGFWSTAFAMINPFWSLYLVVELVLQRMGLV